VRGQVASPQPQVPPPTPAPLAIRLAGVRKRFRRYASRGGYTTLKSSLVGRWLGRRGLEPAPLEVIDGVDLEVAAGTTFGIVGRNGSGKSTLLKLIAGILRPDEGRVEVRGKVSPLIELGAGFHPEFSGRENVYLNGLVLGLSRAELEERFDSIVSFAEIGPFIHEPVRTYSSGMFMRLAFSVAVHADPDVLLIDEILAVGDEAFAAKCTDRLARLQAAGKTIVLVSHDLAAIQRWCHEAAWLEGGRIVERGDPYRVVARYRAAMEGTAAPPPADPAPAFPDSRSPGRLAAGLRLLEPPVAASESGIPRMRVWLELENRGDTVWRSHLPGGRGIVMLGGRLFRAEECLGETERAFLPRDVFPGETVRVELKFVLPGPGRYRVELDLVDEGVCWFADRGSTPLRLEVEA
jgi:ABC-type polysaccharide/polyol phosphate transport system ATPase subunit